MPGDRKPGFHVERWWPRWRLYAMHKYNGRLVAVFWSRQAAEKAAAECNRFLCERPEVERGEAEYEKRFAWPLLTQHPNAPRPGEQ